MISDSHGFFFPLAMIVATIFLTIAVELTYLAKVQTDVVENLQTRMKLMYASQSGTEILRAWHDIDETFGDSEKFSTESNFDETELYRFTTRDEIPVRILLMQNRIKLPDGTHRALFFASTAQIEDSRFETLKRIETSYGFYYFDNAGKSHWFELYR